MSSRPDPSLPDPAPPALDTTPPHRPDDGSAEEWHAAPSVEEFCQSMLPTLVRMLTLRVGSRWVAEDLAQEALARALANWEQVSTQKNPSNYVYRIAVRLAASTVRRRRSERRALKRLRSTRPPIQPGTESKEEIRSDLLRHLASLTRREREVLSLRFGADLSVQAVAEALGVTEGTVKTLSHRAMARLRQRIESESNHG